MTKNDLQRRNKRSHNLRVLQVDSSTFYVESSEGKICYRVHLIDDTIDCTCGDFARNGKNDPAFKCKHILAVYNTVQDGDLEVATILKKKMPKLDERFIMTLEGKDFVKYPGLLDLGHQKGISSIDVDIVQLPGSDNGNAAVCKATVIAKNGDSFIDIGDASPGNCNSKVARHLLRMASTRAIARALRSFTNIGMTCLEELGDLDEAINDKGAKPKKPKQVQKAKPAADNDAPAQEPKQKEPAPENKPVPIRPGKPETAADEKANDNQNGEQESMSTAQKSAIFNLARRRSISQDELEKIAHDTYGAEVDHLSRQDASSFIRHLQQAA